MTEPTNERESLLVKLHLSTLRHLVNRIESGEATAQEMNVARQFLLDNGIQSLLENSDEGKEFISKMGSLPFEPKRTV